MIVDTLRHLFESKIVVKIEKLHAELIDITRTMPMERLNHQIWLQLVTY
ncbi:MAG: hypothetical protein QME25_06760 [Bacteroidota bacterium]|nr:hypothetical protein [Bacteroidota bacterium]